MADWRVSAPVSPNGTLRLLESFVFNHNKEKQTT
jgi:hypothetical protein